MTRDEGLQRIVEMLVREYGIDAIEDAILTMGMNAEGANAWLQRSAALHASPSSEST